MRPTEWIATLLACLIASPLLGQLSSKWLDQAAKVLDNRDCQTSTITLSVMCTRTWQTDEDRSTVVEMLNKALRSELATEVLLFDLARTKPPIARKLVDLIGEQLDERKGGRAQLDAIKAINELYVEDSSIES